MIGTSIEATLRAIVLLTLIACSACTPVRDDVTQLPVVQAGFLDVQTPPLAVASVIDEQSLVAFRYDDMLIAIVFALAAVTVVAHVLLRRDRPARTIPIL